MCGPLHRFPFHLDPHKKKHGHHGWFCYSVQMMYVICEVLYKDYSFTGNLVMMTNMVAMVKSCPRSHKFKSWCGLYTRTRNPFVSSIGWNNIKLHKTAINNPFSSPHLLLIVLNGFSKNSCPYHIKTNTDITYPILNRLILVVPVINMMNNVTQYM